MLTAFLNTVLAGNTLTAVDTERALETLAAGDASPAQTGAFLAALRMKGESPAELVGGARMLRRHAAFIDCGQRSVTDIVGTGGDGGISFNISTASAFVAAGAGVAIAKHGNRAVSGKCGSADVLAVLGFNLDVEPIMMEQAIKETSIGFLFAQKLHPILGRLAPIRRELKIRTIFNMLGPLCNPAGAQSIVLGVYDTRLAELFAHALRELGVKRALVVAGHDGLDEISCVAPTRVAELRADGKIKSYDLFPEMLLGEKYRAGEIAGGDPETNACILRKILSGEEQGAPRAIVMLNAGAAIYVAGLAPDLPSGLALAAQSIDSGRARQKLTELITRSRR